MYRWNWWPNSCLLRTLISSRSRGRGVVAKFHLDQSLGWSKDLNPVFQGDKVLIIVYRWRQSSVPASVREPFPPLTQFRPCELTWQLLLSDVELCPAAFLALCQHPRLSVFSSRL
ncbi:hypothetical protein BDV18DRAFT_63122 [Aspergillus unguis]